MKNNHLNIRGAPCCLPNQESRCAAVGKQVAPLLREVCIFSRGVRASAVRLEIATVDVTGVAYSPHAGQTIVAKGAVGDMRLGHVQQHNPAAVAAA